MTFSEEQLRAIRHGDGPALIIAGPGSGKTATLTNRIKYLIEERDIPPENILTITFSKAAADGMKNRFMTLCDNTFYPVNFGTFHSVFFQIIHEQYRYNTGDIATLRQKRAYMKQAIERGVTQEDNPALKTMEIQSELIDSLLKNVAYYKNMGERGHIEPDCNISTECFHRVYRAYRDIQIAAHKIDFEDMLLMVRNLFRKNDEILAKYRERYRYILIDEYQDINDVQYDIVRMLAAPCNNLFVVGDDDQSIYGFRGSRSELMLGFTDSYPDAVKIELDVNYRCADKIIAAAGKVISVNKIRFHKDIKGLGRTDGEFILSSYVSREDEDRYIVKLLKEYSKRETDGEAALFLRTNREASRYAELIRSAGLKCDMKEAVYNPYKSFVYKDMYHYLKLAEIIRDSEGAGSRQREGIYRHGGSGHVRDVMLPVTHLFPIMNKPVRYLNRRNILCDAVSIEGLRDIYCDRPYMERVLETFATDLYRLSGMDMCAAVNYIRRGMGYDEYVMDNVTGSKEEYDDYTDTADWIQERVKGFRDVDELNRYAEDYEEMMAADMEAGNSTADGEEKKIHIMTYHASKGLEFNTVILPHLNEGSVPNKRCTGQSRTEEERRMLYVAMTRAKDNLYMTYVSGDKERKHMPSRFLSPLIHLNSLIDTGTLNS